jgi:hypothetical protein
MSRLMIDKLAYSDIISLALQKCNFYKVYQELLEQYKTNPEVQELLNKFIILYETLD